VAGNDSGSCEVGALPPVVLAFNHRFLQSESYFQFIVWKAPVFFGPVLNFKGSFFMTICGNAGH
jgi:hypothetical protein